MLALHSARGVAASAVVIAHTFGVMFPDGRPHPSAPDAVATAIVFVGGVAVLFFFVLSGFIMTWSWRPERSIRQYAASRFARIWPSHAAVWALWVVLSVTVWGESLPPVRTMSANLALVHGWVLDTDWQLAMNSPTWSLSSEALMYAALPLMLTGTTIRLWRVAFLGGVALGVTTIGFTGVLAVETVLAWPPAGLLPFVLGIAAAHAMRSRPDFTWTSATSNVILTAVIGVIVAMICLIAASGVQEGESTARVAPFAATFWLAAMSLGALVVGRLAFRDRTRPSPSRHPRVLQTLGTYSYVLYLTHIPAMVTVNHLNGEARTVREAVVLSGFAWVLTAVFSVALHHGVERPIYRRLTRRAPVQVLHGLAPTTPGG